MASSAARGVFISYSRSDIDVVTIAARLLRAGGAKVFQDVVDIEFGAKWQDVLMTAISKCERVLVFWSAAAAASEWVEREWRTALAAGKSIVPMLLDKTPLPSELAVFNAMPDLMAVLRPISAVPTPYAPPRSYKKAPALIVTGGLALGLFATYFFMTTRSSANEEPLVTPIVLSVVVAVLGVIAILFIWRSETKKVLRQQVGLPQDEQGLVLGDAFNPNADAKYELELTLGQAFTSKLFSPEYARVE